MSKPLDHFAALIGASEPAAELRVVSFTPELRREVAERIMGAFPEPGVERILAIAEFAIATLVCRGIHPAYLEAWLEDRVEQAVRELVAAHGS